MQTVLFKDEKKWIDAFLNLPSAIYSDDELTNSAQTELKILMGEHVLSHYFTVQGILVLNDDLKAIARCVLTFYHEKNEAYLGFFECIDDMQAANLLFKTAQDICEQQNKKCIIGPVDSSFWIKYRLKTNKFGTPYTSEPYNKPYYYDMFIQNGYNVDVEYLSNSYNIIPKQHINERREKRLYEFLASGYEIKSPKRDEFAHILQDIYPILTRLYSSFPTFAMISSDEFEALFSEVVKAVDLSMVKLAYFNGALVGFFVTLPNYGSDICGKITIKKIIKMLLKRRRAKQYILLYLGADSEHLGLGSAIAQCIKKELQSRGASSIGALIKRGKVTSTYFSDLIGDTYDYVLLKKDLSK